MQAVMLSSCSLTARASKHSSSPFKAHSSTVRTSMLPVQGQEKQGGNLRSQLTGCAGATACKSGQRVRCSAGNGRSVQPTTSPPQGADNGIPVAAPGPLNAYPSTQHLPTCQAQEPALLVHQLVQLSSSVTLAQVGYNCGVDVACRTTA